MYTDDDFYAGFWYYANYVKSMCSINKSGETLCFVGGMNHLYLEKLQSIISELQSIIYEYSKYIIAMYYEYLMFVHYKNVLLYPM